MLRSLLASIFKFSGDPPLVSIIVVAYNMGRELPRTLQSLTPDYQGLDPRRPGYEVLVMDNGSRPPMRTDSVPCGSVFRYHYMDPAPPSPAKAMNLGARMARGSVLGFIVDGARVLTPGVLRWVFAAFQGFANPVVAVPGWHLGPALQQQSVLEGYDHDVEDGLLARIDWPVDGYRLFDVAVPGGSMARGCIAPMAESNALFLRRRMFDAIGGVDERFDLPGGGLVNLDLYRRAIERDDTEFIVLPGEGTFHQLHGGVSTNISTEENAKRWIEWEAQYRQLTGRAFAYVEKTPILLGRIPRQALGFLAFSASRASQEP